MARLIVVAARDRPDLQLLRHGLRGHARHQGADRPGLAPPEGVIDPERRERGDIYDELQRRGFIMIRMG
jgi:hypothetical protein